MGSPKRQRKKFSKPRHPWQKERILAEKEILQEYWLRRKYEFLKNPITEGPLNVVQLTPLALLFLFSQQST